MQKLPSSLKITETKAIPLSGMTVPEIAAELDKISSGTIKPFRAEQVFSWIKNGASTFREMTNLPASLIKTLEEHAVIRGSTVKEVLYGNDNTIKLVMELSDGLLIETVLLPSDHYTACISTQAGCPIGCVFCKTGSMGFFRNLSPSEIIEQFLYLNDELNKKLKDGKSEYRISNVVVMGMGEPLLNLPALRKSLEILCNPAGFGLSKRKITVSTAGVCKGIIDIAENGPQTELAVSLASARGSLREVLAPGTSNYPLKELKEALAVFQKKQGRQITIEMVLLRGINTSPEDAKALISFVNGLDVVINLIPWNPVNDLFFDGQKIRQPELKEVKYFAGLLESSGLTITQRFRRGRGISGACGQLG